MRVFKSRAFERFASQSGIDDAALLDAVSRAERGSIDADLGGGVIKQRIARPGEGRSGGIRAIILFRAANRAFCVHGFQKSDLSNIGPSELKAFKRLAAIELRRTEAELEAALKIGIYIEVKEAILAEDL
jgi:hypothetical protein